MYMDKEKKLYVLVIGSCVLSILLGVGFGYLIFGGASVNASIYAGARTDAAVPVVSGSVNQVVSAVASSVGEENFPVGEAMHHYVVTIIDGYIAVFYAEHNGGDIKEMTTVPANVLPAADIERLQEGIRIYNEEALARILQDYGS
jgi:hypothetical protein